MLYTNKWCGDHERITQCQQLHNDGACHMSGSGYVKMMPVGNKMNVQPGVDNDCSCNNGNVLSQNFSVDSLDIYGEWVEEFSCESGGNNGLRLVKGTWCHQDTFTSCPPDNHKFTQMIEEHCPNYVFDILSSSMCNYVGF